MRLHSARRCSRSREIDAEWRDQPVIETGTGVGIELVGFEIKCFYYLFGCLFVSPTRHTNEHISDSLSVRRLRSNPVQRVKKQSKT